MSDKFQNKYRIPSARWQDWDYASYGAYFITICTKNREHYFGNIENGKMNLFNAGVLADVVWHEIKNHAKNIELDAFVVMPNHIHGIIILNNKINCDGIGGMAFNGTVETRHALSLKQQQQQSPGQSRFQNQGKNTVSSIIGSYKSAVTKHANRLGIPFGWQSRFYDHIIRDGAEFLRIADYIENNVENWGNDKFFNSGKD
jgi:REP element-mobilizing transposase RayT